MKKTLIINGPNLNLLGNREPDIYGDQSLEEIKNYTEQRLDKDKVAVDWFQSNKESEILEKIHQSGAYHGIVLNPGALSHSSFALYDCLRAAPCPVIEVHLSNTHSRGRFRSDRLSAKACTAVIEGLGKDVYYLGVLAFLSKEQ